MEGHPPISKKMISGAEQIHAYLGLLNNKRIAVVANQTAVISKSTGGQTTYRHLIDSLLSLQVHIKRVFSPEHGFRGTADASELIADGKDLATGLPISSLYGKRRKPSPAQLEGIDLVLFDIQDVGVRFYTYISTLHYVMEACAEQGIRLVLLDRPNPNGHYTDGPTLLPVHQSFVGMHPVPLVYGMTIGEYAQMINGEGWLPNKLVCDLTVIPLKNYNREKTYHLPVRPSPNLPNDRAINLYPSLGFFEGTHINAGRGTEQQFQRYGAPFFPKSDFSYIPRVNPGASSPKHLGNTCYGVDLSKSPRQHRINLTWLLDAYKKTPDKQAFFGPTFTAHAGNKKLEQQLKKGLSATEIRASWNADIQVFKKIRRPYLLYR